MCPFIFNEYQNTFSLLRRLGLPTMLNELHEVFVNEVSIGPSGCPFRASIHFEVCHGWAYLSQSQGKGFLVPGRTLPSKILQLPWSSCFGSLWEPMALGSLLSCVNVEVRGFRMLSILLDSRVSCVGNKAPRRDVELMLFWLFTCSNKVTPIAHLFLHIHRYTFVGMLWAGMPIQILL